MDPTHLLDLPAASVCDLRHRAARLAELATETRRIAARVDVRVASIPYAGPQARGFRDRMAHRHLEALRIAAALDDAAGALGARANSLAAERDDLARLLTAHAPTPGWPP